MAFKNTRDNQAYDWLVKLLVIGDSGVGKSNVLLRACDDKFVESHIMTIGIDFKVKTIDIDGKKVKMQVWDTAGQEKFKTITQTYYKGAMGIILVYAINDRNSFDHIQQWMQQIRENAAENVCLILVGNKCDVADRKVDASEGQRQAEEYDIPFLEASAKENIGVTEVFERIGRAIKENILDKEDLKQSSSGIQSNKGGPLNPNIKLQKNNSQQQTAKTNNQPPLTGGTTSCKC